MGQIVVKMLIKVADLSNANLVKNTDGPQAKRAVDKDVVRIGKDKKAIA